MSGYGTKKRGGDVALQMTFPDVASAVVATNDPTPYGYVGRAMFGKASLPVANDLQQRYHAEKSHYANKSAMDGVHNEERSDWLKRHNTYGYTQPRPKLLQRVFANPSLGNQADIYPARNDVHRMSGGFKPNTRESYPGWEWWFDFSDWLQDNVPYISEHGWDLISHGAPGGFGPGGHYKPPSGVLRPVAIDPKKARVMEGGLHGGVLRTAEGQRYGRNLLKARIAQLNAIQSAIPGSSDGAIGATRFPKKPEIPEGIKDEDMIDLRTKLDLILSTYEEARNVNNLNPIAIKYLFQHYADAEKLLYKIAIDFNMSDFNNVLRYLEEFIQYLGFWVQNVDVNKLDKRTNIMLKYTEGMVKGVNRPRRERILLSNALIKTYGIKPEVFAGMGRVRGGAVGDCDYPEWEQRTTSNVYKTGDKVKLGSKAYEANRSTTTTPPGMYWNEIACGSDAPPPPPPPPNEPKNFNPANVRPRPLPPPPPPPSGVDFSKGENQGYRVLSAPVSARDGPGLEPEEPEDTEEVRKPVATFGLTRFAERERGAKFTEDQRVRFGDRQGAYYGEEIGDRVPVVPVPVPVLPDGEYVHPNSGYVRKAFPKFAVQKKPSNSLKPRRVAPTPKLPMFQDTASGIFSSPRIGIPVVKSLPGAPPFSYTGGRKGLPKTVEGFMELAEKLKGSGHSIRVNPTSKLSSIRQNFIRNLLL